MLFFIPHVPLISFLFCCCWLLVLIRSFYLITVRSMSYNRFFRRLQFMLFFIHLEIVCCSVLFCLSIFSLSFLYFGLSFRCVYLCNYRLIIKTNNIQKISEQIFTHITHSIGSFPMIIVDNNLRSSQASKKNAMGDLFFCSLFNVVQYSALSFHIIFYDLK